MTTKDPFTIAGRMPSVRKAIARSIARPASLPAISVMLDSGAYSAWYHGAPLELHAYIDYAKAHRLMFESIVALDVIPGASRSAAKTAAIIESAAKQSHDNYQVMRRAGLNPIPVFHMGEDFSWLERMLDERIPYIGISPYPRAGQASILEWLDKCFTRLTTRDGIPLCKTHGFGATSYGMITRYPWYTIDSTTWALAAGYGTIIVPQRTRDNQPDYKTAPLRFSISDRDSAGSRPLLKAGDATRRIIEEYLAGFGLDTSDIRSTDRNRAQANAGYYVQLEASLVCAPFAFRVAQSRPRSLSEATSRYDWRPAVLFAEQLGKTDYGRALAKVGAMRRLISYYEIKNHPDIAPVEEYVRTGLWVRPQRAKKPWSTSWVVNRRLGLLARLKEGDPDV